MPTIDWNRKWDRYDWPDHGDEWSGQADYCGQPYETWKASAFETFMAGNLGPAAVSLEVGCGHGRWSSYLVANSARVTLVDLNPSCIDHCRERFSRCANVSYFTNDGASLPFVEDSSVDFIWSYDAFVHMEGNVIRAYLREFARILRPGGRAVLHHAGRRHGWLWLSFVARWGRPGKWFFRILSMKGNTAGGGDGDRGMISRERMRRMIRAAGLTVVFQVDSWGEDSRFDCKRFNDVITGMARPPEPEARGAPDR